MKLLDLLIAGALAAVFAAIGYLATRTRRLPDPEPEDEVQSDPYPWKFLWPR